MIEELQKIALQRCKRAREAISLIGKLAEEYGYADLAECITIADPLEVWQMEIAGSGKKENHQPSGAPREYPMIMSGLRPTFRESQLLTSTIRIISCIALI